MINMVTNQVDMSTSSLACLLCACTNFSLNFAQTCILHKKMCLSLLQELANAKGNILENKELLDSLNKTKQSSITISDSLAESVRLQAVLDQVRFQVSASV